MPARHPNCNTVNCIADMSCPQIVCSIVSSLHFQFAHQPQDCLHGVWIASGVGSFVLAVNMQDKRVLPKSASNVSFAIDTVPCVTCQAVKMLHEEVGSQPEGTCGDMLVLPIYAALPPELQVRPPCCSSSPTMCTTVVVHKEKML